MSTSKHARYNFTVFAAFILFVSLILAGCSGGGGGGSDINSAGTGTVDTTAPSAPTGLVAATASSGSIALYWTAATDDTAVTGYKIYRNGAEVNTSATNSFSDSGLTSSTTYTYTVAARDAAGNTSAKSASASATTLAAGVTDLTAPTAPTGLVTTPTSTNQINLTWTASTDNVSVAGYEVWRGSTKIATVTTLTYSDTGLTAGTSYSYTVKAFDGAGNISVASNTATATTLASGSTESTQVAPDMSSLPVSMTYDERKAALAIVAAFWTANTTSNLDADNTALVDYIRTQPAFADAGVLSDKTVWARFKDGRPVAWVTETYEGFTAALALSPGTIANQAAPITHKRISEVPQGSTAMMIDVYGIGRKGPSTVDDWLNTTGSGYGYNSQKSVGSLDDLTMKIKDVAVLYFSTHGAFAVGQDGNRGYFLATGEPTTSMKWNDMYDLNELDRAWFKKPDHTLIEVWTISEKFVSKYWTFTPDSLIVIDACWLFDEKSLDHATVGSSFRSTLASKSTGNKTTIVGWDDEIHTDSGTAILKLFFDRVLGNNKFQPESPLQRPFSFKQVYDWMKKESLDVDPISPNAKMILEEHGTTLGQLVPSIIRATVTHPATNALHGDEWVLELTGNFGPEVIGTGAGTVMVGNTQLSVYPGEWKEGVITAKLPASMASPGSSGDIVVQVQGHESNQVPLTQLTGTVTQVQTGMVRGGGRMELSCPVRLTADVHFYRENPGETPQFVQAMNVEVQAECNYALSGTWDSGGDHLALYGSGAYAMTGSDVIQGTIGMLTPVFGAPPVDFWTDFYPQVFPLGTLATTSHNSDGSHYTTTSTYYVLWSFATPFGTNHVTLGADYSLTGTLDCQDRMTPSSATCTETWNATPLVGTAPWIGTQS